MEDSLVDGPVPEEAEHHGAGFLHLLNQRGSHGDADAAAHDPVGSQVAGSHVRDMHGPAAPFAVAARLAQQLPEHAHQVPSRSNAVAVAPVGAGEQIPGLTGRQDADRGGLLADV